MKPPYYFIMVVSILLISCILSGKSGYQLNQDEERLFVILDTLKNKYYWQSTPLDMMSMLPTPEMYERIEKECPWRRELINYTEEFDSLLKANLSERLLLSVWEEIQSSSLLKKEYLNLKIIQELEEFNSAKTDETLYIYFIQNPKDYMVGSRLVYYNKYKEEIRTFILDYDTDISYLFLESFDTETDLLILKKIAERIRSDMDNKPYMSYTRAIYIRDYYKKTDIPPFNDDELVLYFNQHVRSLRGNAYEKASNDYYKIYANKVLEYYSFLE